jgi:hypothetical protein
MVWLTVALTGLIVGLAGCGASSSASSPSAVASSKNNVRHQNLEKGARPELVVVSQQSSGYSVLVQRAVVPDASTVGVAPDSGGFIAVMTEVHGLPSDLLGYAKISDGTASNKSIPLSAKLTSGRYFIGLYRGSDRPSVQTKPLASQTVAINAG